LQADVDFIEPVRWGVLGAARIATGKVIPGMQRGRWSSIVAIASRYPDKARAAADAAGIPRSYGSYQELLADPDIEAIYNPLPNHLHLPWSIRAAEAGKHVLCEKPIGLSAAEASALCAVRDRTGVHVAEAFMVRTHPQWLAVRELVQNGRIGELRLISAHLSYYKRDPQDIRYQHEYGGGGLMDVGCYAIMLARWLFAQEPGAVIACVERDPEMEVDRLTSALLRFPTGQATFSCSMQLVPYQRIQVFGTRARIEIEIPMNTPPDRTCRIFLDDGRDLFGGGIQTIAFAPVDHYTLQGDEFSRAVRGVGRVPVPLEDSIGNMAVIDALFRSAETARWEAPVSGPLPK
jgi:predicted dehydrogenase